MRYFKFNQAYQLESEGRLKGPDYDAGQVISVSESSLMRWLRRGLGAEVPAPRAAVAGRPQGRPTSAAGAAAKKPRAKPTAKAKGTPGAAKGAKGQVELRCCRDPSRHTPHEHGA